MAVQIPNPGEGDEETGDTEYVLWKKTGNSLQFLDDEVKRIERESVTVTSELGNSKSLAVSQKLLTDLMTPRLNDIGTAGDIGFGVGITDNLPSGMSEMMSTTIKGHENYGNYQYNDGSVMCYVPRFYYRWGHIDSPNFTKYGANALDVKAYTAFNSVADANAAGYALHRAFYDGGKIKQGIFVDKYQCSNNGGIASSIKFAVPMSTSSANNPISGLTGSISNNYASTIDAAKTRGADFFPTTIFIQKALALLSMAHAQASTNPAVCAWYDSTGAANHPKGCNNNALRDTNDTSVQYEEAGYSNMGKTGSGKLFAKTTHNGQVCGIADLNGNLWETAIGITVESDNFYLLSVTAKASALTSGNTISSDAWGTAGIAANYEMIGPSYGELTGVSRNFAIGSVRQAVFTGSKSGINWAMDGAGIPATGGAGGTNIFGNDRFYDNKTNQCCPIVGGSWGSGSGAGVWSAGFDDSRANGHSSVGFRAALYPV